MVDKVLFSSAKETWNTPADIVERVVRCLGQISLDPCSNEPPYNIPACTHYTAEDDGLSRPWFGSVYMNPPYGRGIRVWVERLVNAYQAGQVTKAIALLPARTDTAWWALLDPYPRCFIRGRLRFIGGAANAPFPSALVYLGEDLPKFIDACCGLGPVYVLGGALDDLR